MGVGDVDSTVIKRRDFAIQDEKQGRHAGASARLASADQIVKSLGSQPHPLKQDERGRK